MLFINFLDNESYHYDLMQSQQVFSFFILIITPRKFFLKIVINMCSYNIRRILHQVYKLKTINLKNTYIIAEIGNNHNGSVSKAKIITLRKNVELMLLNFNLLQVKI